MKLSAHVPTRSWRRHLAVCIAFTLLLGACGSSPDDETVTTADQTFADSAMTDPAALADDDTADTPADTAAADTADTADESVASPASTTGVDIGLFFDGALAGEATTEEDEG